MLNYGEAMGYWYLRLNGFFPFCNFVFHKSPPITIPPGGGDLKQIKKKLKKKPSEYTADGDLFAVRFPHVREKVNETYLAYDKGLLEEIDKSSALTIFALVEVKTGRCTSADLKRAFGVERLQTAIERAGFFKPDVAGKYAKEWMDKSVLEKENYALAKLALLQSDPPNHPGVKFLHRSLDHVNRFIYDRMKGCIEDKEPDRVFFSDPFIQYIIWTAKHKLQYGADE